MGGKTSTSMAPTNSPAMPPPNACGGGAAQGLASTAASTPAVATAPTSSAMPVATGKGSLPMARVGMAEGGIPKFKNFKKPPIPMRRPHAPKMEHAGPIHSSVAGRTDHLPMQVHSGSYVIPADIISGMGEGNTIAGFKHMRRVFGGNPYGSGSAPYGQAGGPYGAAMGHSEGGATDKHEHGSVPIVAAGGEYVLTPDEVRAAGGGDLETGHKVLDEFVLRMRKELVKTLKGLAPPRKD